MGRLKERRERGKEDRYETREREKGRRWKREEGNGAIKGKGEG